MKKPIAIDLSNCPALGDLICATPTISVVAKAYHQKVTVLSPMPELFKNHPDVEKSFKNEVMGNINNKKYKGREMRLEVAN